MTFLCSRTLHRSFITFSVNIWKIEMSIFYNTSLLLSIFRLVWLFLWSKFTCQFRKCVLSMCAKQAEKNDTAKTAQHSRVVQWGEHVSEGAFSKEFFLRHLRLCVHGKSSLIYRISHMNLSLQAQNLWLLFPLALILLLSSHHEKVIKWHLFCSKRGIA